MTTPAPRPGRRPGLRTLLLLLAAILATAAALPSAAAEAAAPAAGPAPAAAPAVAPGSVTVSPDEGLDPGASATTVDVSGSGFTDGSSAIGIYVRYCVATSGRPAVSDCLADPQHWVSAPVPPATALMAPDGSFAATLDLPPSFTSSGVTHDCTVVQCGIFVRRDHNGGGADLSWGSFTPVSFADPTTTTGPSTTTTSTTTTTVPAPPEPGAGTLDWGVRASFRTYVLDGPAQGAVEATPPASVNDDGTYRFPAGTPVTYDGPGDVDARFDGAVRFTGHHGALDMSLSEPRVQIAGATGALVVDASSKDLDTGVVTELDDVAIADLDVGSATVTAAGDVVTFASIPATLTDDGATAFGGFYAAGDPLDPVTFSIEVDDPGELPSPTEELAGCVPATVAAGDTVRVCGEGFTPGEQVQVFLHSEPVFLDVVVAGPDGSVTASVTIPTATRAGEHRIELRGVTSGKVLFTAPFQVAGQVLARTGGPTSTTAAVAALILGAGAVLVRLSSRRAARLGA